MSKVVNDVLVGLTIAIAGWIIYLTWKWIKNKKAKKRTITILLSEIKDIQKELKQLSNCRNKAHNEYDNLSEGDRLPEELNYSDSYPNMRDKLDLLDAECQIKLSQYYKRIATIKEQYKKFEIIHGDSPEILSILELVESNHPLSAPSVDEICKFLESTEETYKLGEELTISLEK